MFRSLLIPMFLVLGTSLFIWADQAPAQPVQMIDVEEESIIGKPAPSVPLKTLDGQDFNLSDMKGKIVVLSFWASWCRPCRGEMPELESVYNDLKAKGVVVVGVNVDREPSKANAFLRAHPVTFPIVLDPNAILLGQYGVGSMPTSFVVDRKGVVRKKTIGYRPEYIQELRKFLETL